MPSQRSNDAIISGVSVIEIEWIDSLCMQKILAGLKGLGRTRLIALGVVAALLLGALGVLVFRGGFEQKALLYGDLELNEAAQMVDDLNKAHISTSMGPDGRSIYVPKDSVANARLLLAKSGLPSGGAVGYELFDKSGTLTSTQFEQGIDETRAMEGELERSIRLVHGVRNVRVHLVLPHRDLFSTQTNPSQASVILDVGRVGIVSPDAIMAIQNLVAAAVPGLQPRSISIVDTRGDVLAKPSDPDSLAEQESSLEKQRHSEEQRLSQAVEDLLSSTLGMGHVRARAAVTMNSDVVRETEESYDPNQQVLRSQTSNTDKSVNTESGQNSTTSNNLPNANAGQNNKSGSSDDRVEETNNYEIGKRTRIVNQTRPRVSRISLAVMVDGTSTMGKDGKPVWQPLDDAQIKRLTGLVQTVVGYDKERGDAVNIVSMPFKLGSGADFPQDSTSFFSKDMAIYVAKWVIPILLIVGAAFMLLRPILRRGKEGNEGESSTAGDMAARAGAAVASMTGVGGPEKVSVDGVEGEMRREALNKVAQKVEESPEETIMIVRNWLAQPDPTSKKMSAG
ncbi:flagellar MS-ring protein [Saccharibacter floricola DSM 15669]|uniref:Flagellar M-ring protein n=2 Tax=Saccharibacter TaxID=231052 RepID=A0ABQ0NXJ3_9PROT|nr:flagellar MS-ring protein [Saccharibacter floricola DSM 15669]